MMGRARKFRQYQEGKPNWLFDVKRISQVLTAEGVSFIDFGVNPHDDYIVIL